MKNKLRNKKEKTQVGIFPKNRENPFLKQTIQEVNNSVVKKYKMATNQSEGAVLHAVDPHTGEMVGHTTFIKQIKVDEEKFMKIYLSSFSAFWDLKSQAIRVFDYIMSKVKPNQDKLEFILDECLNYTKYKSSTSVYQGLSGLLKAQIIARGYLDTTYFINPMVCFNGNRITFADTYLKVPRNQKQQFKHQENQLGFGDEQNKLIESLREENKKLEEKLSELTQVETKTRQMTLEEAIKNEKN